ncbi:MAG: hypothetical protein KAX49_10210 [Halanaerobiales bacterium]|nr:hypothetical protein [Halanaerobiales bacterium]
MITQLYNAVCSLVEVTDKNESHLAETHQILAFINKVAGQIKLLGLNASIEAVRAGSEGVVAEEIRKLANDSQDSTQRINNIIDLIKSSTSETLQFVKRIEETSKTFVNYLSKNIHFFEGFFFRMSKIHKEIICMSERG